MCRHFHDSSRRKTMLDVEVLFPMGHFVATRSPMVVPLHYQDHLMDPRVKTTAVGPELSQLEILLSILSCILLRKLIRTFILNVMLTHIHYFLLAKPKIQMQGHTHVGPALLFPTINSGLSSPSPEPSLTLTKPFLIPLHNTLN